MWLIVQYHHDFRTVLILIFFIFFFKEKIRVVGALLTSIFYGGSICELFKGHLWATEEALFDIIVIPRLVRKWVLFKIDRLRCVCRRPWTGNYFFVGFSLSWHPTIGKTPASTAHEKTGTSFGIRLSVSILLLFFLSCVTGNTNELLIFSR